MKPEPKSVFSVKIRHTAFSLREDWPSVLLFHLEVIRWNNRERPRLSWDLMFPPYRHKYLSCVVLQEFCRDVHNSSIQLHALTPPKPWHQICKIYLTLCLCLLWSVNTIMHVWKLQQCILGQKHDTEFLTGHMFKSQGKISQKPL